MSAREFRKLKSGNEVCIVRWPWWVQSLNAKCQNSECKQKEQVLKCFPEVDGRLRLVITTAAFGMGIDCPDSGES